MTPRSRGNNHYTKQNKSQYVHHPAILLIHLNIVPPIKIYEFTTTSTPLCIAETSAQRVIILSSLAVHHSRRRHWIVICGDYTHSTKLLNFFDSFLDVTPRATFC